MVPAEAPAPEKAPHDDTLAPIDITVAPAALADEITDVQAFLRDRFASVNLAAAPAHQGSPKVPIVCGACKLVFHSSYAKFNHVRRCKYSPL